MDKTKICTKCNIEKEFAEFYKSKISKDKLKPRCKKCTSEDSKGYVNKIRDKNKKDNKEIKVKICSKCKKEKAILSFSKNACRKDGYNNICRRCKSPLNREIIRYNIIDGKRVCHQCKIEKAIDEFQKNERCEGGYVRRCIECDKEYYRLKATEYKENNKKIDRNNIIKVCNRCKKEKSGKDFWNHSSKKDGLSTLCKMCSKEKTKEYYDNNRDKILSNLREYREENKERINNREKKYRKTNKKKTLEKYKRANNKNVKFSTYAHRLTVEENAKEGKDGTLIVECANIKCKNNFQPTRVQINNRIACLDGKQPNGGECRLYCSEQCKEECDIYGAILIPKSQRSKTKQARCNQSRVREVLLEIQQKEFNYNYCEKCGKEFKKEELYFHHNIPIADDYKKYDDASHYMIVCKNCHTHEGCLNG